MAILIVVLSHTSHLIGDFTAFPWIPLPDGVDLFFVLSGYLVGTIFIRLVSEKASLGWTDTFSFLRRRWFRTLPNYFLFLLINIILVALGLIKGELNVYLLSYFVFLQNFHVPFDFLFWESWSLAVEEWFYISLPLVLIILSTLFRGKFPMKRMLQLTLALLILGPLFYRILQAGPWIDQDLFVRKLVITRLDTIGFGLLGALIHFYHPNPWKKFRWLAFTAGSVLMVLLLSKTFNQPWFMQTWYYSFVGLSILLLLPVLSLTGEETVRWKPVRFISKISYSMYLVHIPLTQLLEHRFPVSNLSSAWLVFALVWGLTLLLSWLIWKYFEAPFTRLRERKMVEIETLTAN